MKREHNYNVVYMRKKSYSLLMSIEVSPGMVREKIQHILITITAFTVVATFVGCSSNSKRNNSNPMTGTPSPGTETPYDEGEEKTKLTLATGFDNTTIS